MEAGSPRRSARQRGGAAKGAGECERWRRESPEDCGRLQGGCAGRAHRLCAEVRRRDQQPGGLGTEAGVAVGSERSRSWMQRTLGMPQTPVLMR